MSSDKYIITSAPKDFTTKKKKSSIYIYHYEPSLLLFYLVYQEREKRRWCNGLQKVLVLQKRMDNFHSFQLDLTGKIGRASCRERVWSLSGEGAIEYEDQRRWSLRSRGR